MKSSLGEDKKKLTLNMFPRNSRSTGNKETIIKDFLAITTLKVRK